ncbi:AMP-binding protein, partial [Micromonospora sediminicola]
MEGAPRSSELLNPTGSARDGVLRLLNLAPHATAQVHSVHAITGPLNTDALRAAWQTVLHHHGIPTHAMRAAQDHRGLRGDDTASFHLTDLRRSAAPRDTDAICAPITGRLIDPAQEPPVQLHLIRTAEQTHLLVLVAHQLCADQQGATALIDDLSEHYNSTVTGLPIAATLRSERLQPPPPAPVCPPAKAQQTPLDLPSDRPRSSPPAPTGAAITLSWPRDTARLLHDGAARTHVQPATFLAAAFHSLLYRYSGVPHTHLAVTTTRRPVHAPDGPGCFANLRIIEGTFTDRPTFTQVLNSLTAQAGDITAPPTGSFDDVVRVHTTHRDLWRMPLAEALVRICGHRSARLNLIGTHSITVRPQTLTVTADLTLDVHWISPTIDGYLEFRTPMFSQQTAGHIVAHLRTLLTVVAQHPGIAVEDVPLETPPSPTLGPRPPANGPSVPVLVDRHRRRNPDAPAVQAAGHTTTYAHLLQRAAHISAALAGRGVTPGSAVAIRIPPGPDQIAALLGAWNTQAFILCLGTGDIGERGRGALTELHPAALLVAANTGTDKVVSWYREHLTGVVLDVTADEQPRHAGTPQINVTPADTRAYVAYTSGSTGRPKGIPMTHAALSQFVTWFAERFGIGPGSRVAQWAAPGYDASLVEAFAALTSGATLCPTPERIRAHPGKIVDWLITEGITVFQTVPSFARELLNELNRREHLADLGHLRHLLLAGEALPGDLVNALTAALPTTRIVNLYGPTETILATAHEITSDVHGPTPIGHPIPGREVYIVDENDRLCPTGVTGHLIIHSPYATSGYIGHTDATSGAFEPLRGSAS